MIARGYTGARAYSQSKLAQIMFTMDLADELAGRNVTVNSLHPATYMNTTMVRQSGTTPISTVEGERTPSSRISSCRLSSRARRPVLRSAAASPTQAQAYDEAARARLRGLSLRLTGLEGDGDA